MALTGAVANFTFTAAHAPDGLVPFLNSVTRSPSSRTVLVSLPAGTVRRGTGALTPLPGLTILLQGQGKDGAGSTTLDLEKQNLDLRSALGDDGRVEFHRLRMTNVRALPHSTRLCCAPTSCSTAVCAGLCGISAPPWGRRIVVGAGQAPGFFPVSLFVCLCVSLSTCLLGPNAHTRPAQCAHSRARTRVWRRYE
jgi:hypothetical protein